MIFGSRHIKRIVLVLSLALLNGCALFGPPGQAQLLNADDVADAGVASIDWPRSDWWTQYGDEQLNAWINEAVGNNPNLRIASARLRRTEAAAESVGAKRLPSAAIDFNSTRQRLSENDIYPRPLAGSTLTQSRFALDFSYELDFWGKNRAALDAAVSQARAAEADVQAARLMLSIAVAKTYFQLQYAEELHELLENTVQQREEILDLTRQRVTAGVDTKAELKQAEAAVPAARQELAANEYFGETLRHQLAALLGKGPDYELSVTPLVQLSNAADVPSALPLDLVGRRPDLVAARWRVEAAAKEVSVARTQYFPNVNLLAFVGFSSIALDKLFLAGSRMGGVGPAVRVPLFEGGQISANVAGRSAEYDVAVEQYNTALIEALREVADAISLLRSLDAQQREQNAAQGAAEEAYDLALQRYRAGLSNYLNVLAAENVVLAQRRLHADLAARALDAQVNLIKALGGGYQSDLPPTAQTQRVSQEKNND